MRQAVALLLLVAGLFSCSGAPKPVAPEQLKAYGDAVAARFEKCLADGIASALTPSAIGDVVAAAQGADDSGWDRVKGNLAASGISAAICTALAALIELRQLLPKDKRARPRWPVAQGVSRLEDFLREQGAM